MAPQKPKGARTTWDVNQVGTNGNPNWRGNNSNRWGRGNNSRNNPGHEGYNPNRAPWGNKADPPPIMKRVICYRCKELGHYANECPNPKVDEGYVPLCGNCKLQRHTTKDCRRPRNFGQPNQISNDKYPNRRPTQIQNEDPDYQRQVSRVEAIHAVTTRAQRRELPKEAEGNSEPSLSMAPPLATEVRPPITTLPGQTGELTSNLDPVVPSGMYNPIPNQHLPNPDIFPAQSINQPIPALPKSIQKEIIRTPMGIPKSFPSQEAPTAGLKFGKKKRALGITKDMEPYDILKDLDKLQPSISMKQLLAMALECRTTLNTSLIRRRSKVKKVHEVSLNPDLGAPTSMLPLTV